MKLLDIALKHDLDEDELYYFLKANATFPVKENFWGEVSIPDDVDILSLIQPLLQAKAEKELLRQQKEHQQLLEAQQKQQAELDQQEQLRQQQEAHDRKSKEEKYHLRISKLKEQNAEGYYEYKVISLLDIGGIFNSNSGRVDVAAMTQTLNELGIAGWRLVTAYSNELGKNALSGGAGGILLGANSTVDENILIFERFVKF